MILYSIEEMVMSKKQPNKFIAPIVIAGITVGFFISAYKFVFTKTKQAGEQMQQGE